MKENTKLKVLKFGFFAVWAGWALVCLAIAAGVIWVAIHFAHKYW